MNEHPIAPPSEEPEIVWLVWIGRRAANIAAVVLFLSSIIYPQPYEMVMVLVFAAPLPNTAQKYWASFFSLRLRGYMFLDCWSSPIVVTIS